MENTCSTLALLCEEEISSRPSERVLPSEGARCQPGEGQETFFFEEAENRGQVSANYSHVSPVVVTVLPRGVAGSKWARRTLPWLVLLLTCRVRLTPAIHSFSSSELTSLQASRGAWWPWLEHINTQCSLSLAFILFFDWASLISYFNTKCIHFNLISMCP